MNNLIGDYNFVTKYAYKLEDGTKETWEQAADRIWDTHLFKYATYLDDELIEYINKARESEKNKEFLSAQRLRQFAIPDMNKGILKHNFKAYNCSATYMDRPRAFAELMYVLLCGSGAGLSVQQNHIKKLPPIKGYKTTQEKQYIIDDSIEGWADAIDILMMSYMFGEPEVIFDYSKIRPKGALIAGQFVAPGPDGLKNSINKIKEILDKTIGRRLLSIEIYDISMWIASAVLSGGVRRSATLVMFSPEDELMMNAKTGNWFTENPQRALSNNSAMLVRSKSTKPQLDKIIESTKQFGEPGFIFVDHEDVLYNPCVEIGLLPKNKYGNSGWAVCNLTEINAKAVKDKSSFMRIAESAAVAGTLQAGYTSFPYLGKVTEGIIKRDALLGVSITGWANNPSLFNADLLKEVATHVKKINHIIANKLGINRAKRTTAVKPAGNSSILLGTTSGIHAEHARRYIRNIQANKSEIGQYEFRKVNGFAVENKVRSTTDNILSFAMSATPNTLTRKDMTGVNQLELVKLVQESWVEAGTNEDEVLGIKMRHNVSNTVTVESDQWEEVTDYLWKHKNVFSGVSFLSAFGDKDYPQAPFQEVKTPIELAETYGSAAILASGLIVEAPGVFDHLWIACDAAKNHVNLRPKASDPLDVKIQMNKQYDWVRRLKKFSKNYCDNDLDKGINCLKDVYLLHKWNKLKNESKPVDWKNVDFSEEALKNVSSLDAACVGGNCEVT